jgi:dTDP-4-amino-4,6-dideoxygalactose transaminase
VNPPRIPFARPLIGEEEIEEVVDTLRSGWLTTGPKTKRFEEEFARYIGVPHALGTSSCTAALHLGLASLGIGQGHEVITSTLTFAATANVIVHLGARPVFVDIDPQTLNLDLAAVDAAVTSKTRAVIAVHYGGRMADMPGLLRLCTNRGLHLVEDAAHAVGASLAGRAAGAWGDVAGFSFYANKNLTTGEGGMMTTDSEQLLAKARTLRLQGMTRDVFRRSQNDLPSWRYEIVAAGYKYAMTDIEAAIGIHQLAKLPSFQDTRHHLAVRYDAGLAGLPGLSLPAAPAPDMVHAYHLYVVRISRAGRRDRDAVFAGLAARNIEASVHFVPLHLQPYFQEAWGYKQGQFPRAEAAFREILSLPLHAGMHDDDQDRVIEAIEELVGP